MGFRWNLVFQIGVWTMKTHPDQAVAMNHLPEEPERMINPAMQPAVVDIKEMTKGYVFQADVPGLSKAGI